LKILQVIPYFPPAYVFGGPVTVAYQICRELSRRGHEVTVYTTDARDLTTRLNAEGSKILDGIRIHYFRNISMRPVKWSKLFMTPELFSAAKNEVKSFDIIHLHEYYTFQNVVLHRYAKRYGVPYVLQAHGSLPRIGKAALKWFYDQVFGHRILRDASKVIALTETEFQQFVDVGISEDKIEVIPNGIDLSEYMDLPSRGGFKAKYGIKEDRRIILYLGRIHKTKRIDLLLKAYANLVNEMKIENVLLVIAGPDDGYLYEAKCLSDSLGISDSVLFTGFISNEEKRMALVDAEVLVIPSFNGFPMTFLESCLAGTPVITTTLGDTLSWIDGDVGYVTLPTHLDLAKAVYNVISNEHLHQKLSTNCRNTVKEFSLDKIVDKLERVYGEVSRGR
jgi:glycosyltransferase involved in cell wall biosynthesis